MSKASTRLHRIRTLFRRTFAKRESIDGVHGGIYNIRAPRYLSFGRFLWYSSSFATRGPFNYSRCGITSTVIFVRAKASVPLPIFFSRLYPR